MNAKAEPRHVRSAVRMSARNNRVRRSRLARCLAMAIACGAMVAPSLAADGDRARRIAAELDIYRRDWTICTVSEVGRMVEAQEETDATAIADKALARCAAEEEALRARSIAMLGAEPGKRLMERLRVETREALIGSARTLGARAAGGSSAEPAWPRVLHPTR